MKTKLFSLMLVVLFACSHKDKERTEWKELEEFHRVMAAVYHPLKDSNNLEPAKKRMKELSASAELLASSKIPSAEDNRALKELVEKIKTDSKSLATEIDNAAGDEVIKAKLNSLHDEFHKLMELSEGEKENHHEEEHEDED